MEARTVVLTVRIRVSVRGRVRPMLPKADDYMVPEVDDDPQPAQGSAGSRVSLWF